MLRSVVGCPAQPTNFARLQLRVQRADAGNGPADCSATYHQEVKVAHGMSLKLPHGDRLIDKVGGHAGQVGSARSSDGTLAPSVHWRPSVAAQRSHARQVVGDPEFGAATKREVILHRARPDSRRLCYRTMVGRTLQSLPRRSVSMTPTRTSSPQTETGRPCAGSARSSRRRRMQSITDSAADDADSDVPPMGKGQRRGWAWKSDRSGACTLGEAGWVSHDWSVRSVRSDRSPGDEHWHDTVLVRKAVHTVPCRTRLVNGQAD